jgi:adenylate kinase
VPTYLLFMGAPGAGKGTQAQILRTEFGLPQIASGDLFRDNLKRMTPLGQLAKTYMDKGELVPDDVTIGMIRQRLHEADAAPGAVLDGFPRTLAQAEGLDKLLAEFSGQVNLVLYLKVRDSVLLDRLAGRWVCRGPNQHTYHLLFNPPQVAGQCDVCGADLYQREDDTAAVQARRIKVFIEQTAPLVEFYTQRKQLVTIDGEQAVSAVSEALRGAVRPIIAH